MKKTRAIWIILCIAAVIQFLTSCGGGGGDNSSIHADTTTGAVEDDGALVDTAIVSGMFTINIPSIQHMQSLNYIAKGQITYGTTREVYAASDKYRMQSQTLLSVTNQY